MAEDFLVRLNIPQCLQNRVHETVELLGLADVDKIETYTSLVELAWENLMSVRRFVVIRARVLVSR